MVWLKHFHNPSFFFLWKLNSSLVLTSCSYVRFLSIAVQFPPTLHAATQCTSVARLYVSIIFPLGRLVFYFQQSLKPNIKLSPILLTTLAAELPNCVCHSTVSPPYEKDCILLAFWDNLQCKVWGWLPKRKKEKRCLLRHSEQISLSYNAYIAHFLQLPYCLLACHSSRQKLPHSFCWWTQNFLYMSRRRTCMERCSHLNQSFSLAQISCLFWKCSLWAKRTKTCEENKPTSEQKLTKKTNRKTNHFTFFHLLSMFASTTSHPPI